MKNLKQYLIKLIVEQLEEVDLKKDELNAKQKANLNFLLLSKFEIGVGPKEDPIADDVVSSLLDSEFERTGNFDIYDNPPAALTAPKVMEEFVKKIEPLSKFKIERAITGKSYGKIFKLDNGHILKIFFGGVDVEEDMDWYKKCNDLMHAGGAKLTTLPVYDYGKIKLKSMPNAFIGYVEMAEVEPLDNYLKATKRASGDNPGWFIVSKLQTYFIEAHFKKGMNDLGEIKKFIQEKIKIFDSKTLYADRDSDSDEGPSFDGGIYRPLTDEEANNIVEAFYDMVKLGFQLSDVAPRNMGVLKQSSPTDPKIVIFDR